MEKGWHEYVKEIYDNVKQYGEYTILTRNMGSNDYAQLEIALTILRAGPYVFCGRSSWCL
jgi:hypothetical protein